MVPAAGCGVNKENVLARLEGIRSTVVTEIDVRCQCLTHLAPESARFQSGSGLQSLNAPRSNGGTPAV